ncbi:hypothetical protein ACLI4R_03680 [Natrialbaceae archaeon A-chndr2]
MFSTDRLTKGENPTGIYRTMSTEAGAARWMIQKPTGASLGLIMFGFIFAVFSSPALVVISQTRPEILPFAWLALIISMINSIGFTRKNVEELELLEEIKEMDRAERKQYILNLFFILIGAFSIHIGAIAVIAGMISIDFGYALLGVFFAIVSPKVDAYFSRNYAVGLSQFGYYVAMYTLFAFAMLSGTSRDVAKAAAQDARTVV